MNNSIEIESPMRKAAREGIESYLPTFRGQHLDVEGCIPEVSLKNLREILKAKVKLTWAEAVENGHIYLAFDSGETYLATGFAVGGIEVNGKRRSDPRIIEFAQFLSEALGGTTNNWCKKLMGNGYDVGFRGEIELDIEGLDVEGSSGPKIFDEI